jgi:hypothetical protein
MIDVVYNFAADAYNSPIIPSCLPPCLNSAEGN